MRNGNIEEKSWNEFRDNGFLWFINRILHTFGWVIVLKSNENGDLYAFPARTKYRGFDPVLELKGFKRFSKILKNSTGEIYEETINSVEESLKKSKNAIKCNLRIICYNVN